MGFRKLMFFLVVISVIPSASNSQPAQETTESVLAKYVAALGGLERLRDIHSLRCSADLWVEGLKGHVTWVGKWPASSVIELQWPNGSERHVSTGPIGVPGRLTDLPLPTEMAFGPLVAQMLDGTSTKQARYLGERNDEGVRAQVVELLETDGTSRTYYLDRKTFLPFKVIERKPQWVPFEEYYGGWYMEGGVAFASRADTYRNGMLVRSGRRIQCTINAPVDDAVFAKGEAK